MKHIQLYENFSNENPFPFSITVKPTQEYKNRLVEMKNSDGKPAFLSLGQEFTLCINESLDDEYNYDNAKNNPDTIFVKFTPEGEGKFSEQYIEPTTNNHRDVFVYYGSWQPLWPDSSKGLEMKDNYFYLLFKLYDPEYREKNKNYKGYPPATLYFIKYNKEAGEIIIYSLYAQGGDDKIQDMFQANYSYEFEGNKLNLQLNTYCRFNKDGKERVVDVGSTDHCGYFEVVDII
jgi:hypothetical protein